MKRVLLLLCMVCCLCINAFAQSKIYGVVYYHKAYGKTADKILISAFECGEVLSNSNGTFILTCNNKKPGQKLKLTISNPDTKTKAIEVVNSHQLEWLRIPEDSNNEPINIIICEEGEKNKHLAAHYQLKLEKNTVYEYRKKLDQLEEELKELSNNTKERLNLLNQIDALRADKETALEKIEEQAQFIASIDLNRASSMVKSAIFKIESEEDIEAALLILDDEQLEAAYIIALENKLKAEEEIRKVIEGYELKINLLLPKFKYREAIFYYENIIEKHLNNNLDEEQLANWYIKAANVINDNGQYEKALEFDQKAMDIQEEILEPKHPDLATSYNNIALTYQSLGQYEKALRFQQKDIDIREEILEPKHPDLATSYNNIALTYQSLGQYEKALEFQQKTIDILEAVLEPKHPSQATSYNNIGGTYQSLGQYEKALEFLQKAIGILEAVLEPKHPDLAASYNNIGATYESLGQYEKALDFQQKAIDIEEAVLEPKHPSLATSYNNIGNIYKSLGQYEKSLKFQQKAIDIREAVLESKHPDIANSYNNIALTYKSLGQYEIALDFQQKAIAIFKEVLPKDHPYQKIFFDNLIKIYSTKGQTAMKKKNYLNALTAYKAANEHKESSDIWNRMGICHYYLKAYTKAIEAYEHAAHLSPEIKSQSYYNNIGNAYVKNKQFKAAKEAFQAYEKLFPQEGRPQRNWAMYYTLKNENDKAITHLQKAIELGYDDLEWLNTDDSMDGLRKEPLFIEMIKHLEKSGREKEDQK